MRDWFVYVIQSQAPRSNEKGRRLPGFFYVGCTTDPARRLREHNGELRGGGRFTACFRPWQAKALFGPYANQSDAMKAERALKKGKRGLGRVKWSTTDSSWCRGLGPDHPWVNDPFWVNGLS